MARHQPIPITELKKLHKARNVNAEYLEKLTSLERFALFVTEKIGTIGFFFLLLICTLVWILWNSVGPTELRFDPFPGFVLWLFISNMIQLLFLPLIMIGQNLQARRFEARSQADFAINIQAEKEIETILQHLENQYDLSLEILHKLEKENKGK